jgi:phospholipid-binding lipoprotein MlaA
MHFQYFRSFLLLLPCFWLIGCATAPGRTTNNDPWEGFNRGVYKFNDVVDRAAIKPVAKGYQKITPAWLRTGISNFLDNLEQPFVIVNELLQGKPSLMAQNTCRLVLNTTVGLGGFIDVAGRLGLPPLHEDFGQTLAVWGVPSGPYLVLPFVGPSNLRDGPSRIADYFGQAQLYFDIPWEAQLSLTALEIIDTRQRLFATEDAISGAYDRYGIIRDAWVQRREYLIFDGNPPQEDYEDPEAEDDADTP